MQQCLASHATTPRLKGAWQSHEIILLRLLRRITTQFSSQ
ncbi:hypothetical protein RFEPED_0360 [Rickettsia felis str. Pedreira]|uniref:Uncharacterized protein n=1 Tax=Rickettsia felis str. Pedreira TaxID=1359196 RepID=A0A0F3MTR0_RICFI|nr:hypothetical protein RFEPED_0360 [Rickettsia felis str. Pedreira]